MNHLRIIIWPAVSTFDPKGAFDPKGFGRGLLVFDSTTALIGIVLTSGRLVFCDREKNRKRVGLRFGKTAEQRLLVGEAGLASNEMQSYLSSMFFAEIKPQIEQLLHDDLLKTMAYLKHLLRAENPVYQRELAQRHSDIEAGRAVSLTEAKQRLDRG